VLEYCWANRLFFFPCLGTDWFNKYLVDVLQAKSNWNKTYEDVCCETMCHNATGFLIRLHDH
jgi:hypothetical protein